eukprot:2365642-Amphidinium_carterae.1
MPPNSSMMTTRPFSVEAADTKGLWTAAACPTTHKGIPFSPWHAMVADPLSARISPLAVLKVLLVSSFFWLAPPATQSSHSQSRSSGGSSR